MAENEVFRGPLLCSNARGGRCGSYRHDVPKRPSVAADNWQHRRERDSSLFRKLGVLTGVKYRSLPSFTRSRVMDLEHGGKICKYVYGKRMHYSDDYYGGRCADQLSDF